MTDSSAAACRHDRGAGVLAVLGMHRSGTSCLTGLLENAGLPLGEVSRWNSHNRKGNNEDQNIITLHDEVLADNGATWDAPPRVGCEWSARRLTRLDTIIAGYAHLSRWAFKDPRTLYTLEGWLERLPEMRFIASFRHPLAVARSLRLRAEGGDRDRYVALWMAYNRRLIEFHDRFGFDLVCFDLASAAYLEQVRSCARRLGLESRVDVLTFFDPELRNQGEEEGYRLSPEAEDLYRMLQERASG